LPNAKKEEPAAAQVESVEETQIAALNTH